MTEYTENSDRSRSDGARRRHTQNPTAVEENRPTIGMVQDKIKSSGANPRHVLVLEWRRYVYNFQRSHVGTIYRIYFYVCSNETRSDLHRLNAQSKLSGSRIVQPKHARVSRGVCGILSELCSLLLSLSLVFAYFFLQNNSSLARLTVPWCCWRLRSLCSCWQQAGCFFPPAGDRVNQLIQQQICEQVQHM